MEFRFVYITTVHVNDQFKFIDKITAYLEYEFRAKNYGTGLIEAIFGIGCNGPLSDAWKPTETGEVNQMKFTKAKKRLELTVSLNYLEVKKVNDDGLIEIVKTALLKTYQSVVKLGIKDFEIEQFYKDIDTLLSDREWLKNHKKYKRPPFIPMAKEIGYIIIPQELKMDDDDFWDLIQASIEFNKGDNLKKIEFLIEKLHVLSEEEILGFELMFRELIRLGHNYNLVALLTIIEGSVTDDDLLYFTCNLILYGRSIFDTCTTLINGLKEKVYYDEASEGLLSVGDRAFLKKFGENTDKELPSSKAEVYIDYNNITYVMVGSPWNSEKDFQTRFRNLINLYK